MTRLMRIAAALALLAGPVLADDTKVDKDGERYRLLSCHQQVTVPAQFKVSKKLIKPSERRYVKKGNMIELREYPAIYQEIRTKVRDEYIVMKPVPCAKGDK